MRRSIFSWFVMLELKFVKKRETKQSNDCNKSDNGSDSEYNDSTMEKTLVLQNKLLNKIAKKVDEDHQDTMVVDLDKNKDDSPFSNSFLNTIENINYFLSYL